MKLSVCLLLCTIGLAQASGSYAQKATVNLEMRNQTVKEVLDEIEEQSDFSFFFNIKHVDLDRKVSVVAKKSDIFKVLETVFAGTDVRYSVVDRKIILSTEKPENQQAKEEKIVRGVVKDLNGEPVIGANVSVKGTTLGTITGMDGDFVLEVPGNAIIQVSYIGYVPQELRLGGRNHLDVVLKEDSQALEEVVVVGYGTQKKVNLTGAVETVKSEAIASKPVSSVAQALTGEAAGVTVIQRSSKPGAYDESIRIRGVGTWGDANPLVLVDGIEIGMDKINPNDIESVSVLKDAAAASIYGSRAGNGVILITTKKGTKGDKPIVSFSSNLGVQIVTRFVDKADALTYCKKMDKGLVNEGSSPKFADMIDQMEAGNWDPDHLVSNTDWVDEVLRPAFQQNHNVSVTGGNKNISYMASLGYFDQKSVIGNNTDFERYNTRLNTRSQITDWFGFDANMAYMVSTANEPSVGTTEITMRALNIESFYPVQFSDGTYVHSTSNPNPVRIGFTDDYGNSKTTINNFSGLISPELSKWGFKLKGLLAYERQNYRKGTFWKTVKYNEFIPVGETIPVQNEAITVSENKKTDDWNAKTNITMNATLNYENTFGVHDIKVLLGCSREILNYENTSSSMSGFPNNDLDAIGAGTTKPVISGDYYRQALSSYFGRINYSFKNRYLVEANIRRDGSSKFARGHRWGTFPSGSIGWRISEESFFTPARKLIDNLKIRASYGRLGNNRIDKNIWLIISVIYQ